MSATVLAESRGHATPAAAASVLLDVRDVRLRFGGIVALDGHWIRANKSLCEMLGYSEAELQALTLREVTHPDDIAVPTPAVPPPSPRRRRRSRTNQP